MYSSYHHDNAKEEQCIESLKETFKFVNKDEIQTIHDDESKLIEIINDQPQVKNLDDDKEALLASNKSIAEYNVGLEPRLAQEKAQLATTYRTLKDLKTEYEQNKQKLDRVSGRQELDTTLALLETEAAKSEETSEDTATTFLDGNMELDEFITKYLSERTVAHARKVKVEKMQEIIRNSRRGQGYTSNHAGINHPSHQPSHSSVKGGVPSYPVGNPAFSGSSWSTAFPQNSFGGIPNHNAYFNK